MDSYDDEAERVELWLLLDEWERIVQETATLDLFGGDDDDSDYEEF